MVTAASGVLAQFGGVTLAFAFIATIGLSGFVTVFLREDVGVDLYASGVWLFELPGLILVYTYFQIPLMVIVFLPALDGIRPQWREATESLGGIHLAVLAPGGRSAARPGRSSARRCCCSPTPSPRTRPRPPWSARATRSSRCRSAAR